jgi:protocatechuate 3,4-dioxygenase, alpha subunit
MALIPTPWQTVGPYFSIGSTRGNCDSLAPPGVAGRHIVIAGCVLDGDGVPVPDSLLELWQANSYGKYAHPEDTQDKPIEPGFRGYGRIPTDDDGKFRFSTIQPGPVPGPDGKPQAPHIEVSVFARGLMRRLVTRIYFPDEDAANETDFALSRVEPHRRRTLIARKVPRQAAQFEWNVILQGAGETVFFDC